MMDDVLTYLGLVLVILWLVWLSRRPELKPKVPTDQSKPPDQWKGPAVGTIFEHCGRRCVVVGDGFHDGSSWHEGVSAHYADDSGQIRELFITAGSWDAAQRRSAR